jgi:hypothetical protein
MEDIRLAQLLRCYVRLFFWGGGEGTMVMQAALLKVRIFALKIEVSRTSEMSPT